MSDAAGTFKAILYAFSDGAAFLFGTKAGLAIVAAAIVLAAVLRMAAALSERRLLAKAAGEVLGRGAAFGVAMRELGSMVLRAVAALPAIAAVAAAAFILVGVAESSRRLDEYLAGRARIAELTATVRNLERRYRAVDVAVEDVSDGYISAELAYYDSRSPNAPSRKQKLRLRGRELFVDAIVCNFAYSEIAAGRAVNLAIPYRAFTDEVPQSEGVALDLSDEKGVPLMYRRGPEDLYGIAAPAYDARLSELVGMLQSEQASRGAGIVRSLYGNAVHRVARKGDSFTIWVEQTGGLSVKEARTF